MCHQVPTLLLCCCVFETRGEGGKCSLSEFRKTWFSATDACQLEIVFNLQSQGRASLGWFHRFRTDEMNFTDLKQILQIPTLYWRECESGWRAGCVSVFNGESRVTHPMVLQQVCDVSAQFELTARNIPKCSWAGAAEQTVKSLFGASSEAWGNSGLCQWHQRAKWMNLMCFIWVNS